MKTRTGMRTMREGIGSAPVVRRMVILRERDEASTPQNSGEIFDPDSSMHTTAKARADMRARVNAFGSTWWFERVFARAEVLVPMNESGVEVFEFPIESAGLYGIESDSGDDYFAEVGGEEIGELRAILEKLNVAVADDVTIERRLA